jgi:methionyl-tRNA formyltransferase
MKIVFLGSSHNVFPLIEALKNNFDLVLVITTETEEKASIIPYCTSKGIEIAQVHSKGELKKEIFKTTADLGVVADFGLIIPDEVLKHFRFGVLNVHPSLLPKYRGPTPVQQALLEGEDKTGVTIIKLDEKMDHGPILARQEQQISPDDTSQSLYEILFRIGADLLIKVIEPYIKGDLEPALQDHSQATFTGLLTKQSGFIKVSELPSFEKLNRMTKAYFPWPGVWTRTQVSETEEKLIKFLPFKRVQVEGKKEMEYKDFINGYKEADPNLLNFLKENADI